MSTSTRPVEQPRVGATAGRPRRAAGRRRAPGRGASTSATARRAGRGPAAAGSARAPRSRARPACSCAKAKTALRRMTATMVAATAERAAPPPRTPRRPTAAAPADRRAGRRTRARGCAAPRAGSRWGRTGPGVAPPRARSGRDERSGAGRAPARRGPPGRRPCWAVASSRARSRDHHDGHVGIGQDVARVTEGRTEGRTAPNRRRWWPRTISSASRSAATRRRTCEGSPCSTTSSTSSPTASRSWSHPRQSAWSECVTRVPTRAMRSPPGRGAGSVPRTATATTAQSGGVCSSAQRNAAVPCSVPS